jgi:hypothetical protein
MQPLFLKQLPSIRGQHLKVDVITNTGLAGDSDTQTNYYGVQSKTNTWIRSFLSNRIQAVLLGGETPYL